MMSLLFNSRLVFVLLAAAPFLGGAGVPAQTGQALLMGAWVGWLLAAPALLILLWALGLRDAGQTLRPLIRWPVILLIGAFAIGSLDNAPALLGPAAMGMAFWLWLRRGFRLV